MENQEGKSIYAQKYNKPLPENVIQGVDYDVLYKKLAVKELLDPQEKIAYAKMKRKLEYYQEIDLDHVCKEMGAIRRAKDRWKFESGNSIIYTDDQRWKYVYGPFSEYKNRFATGLIAKEYGLNDFQVIDWYTEKFGETYDESLKIKEEYLIDGYSAEKANKKSFAPPIRDDSNWEYAYDYLTINRNLPAHLIQELFDQGKLYADTLSRCIFLSGASAEIRATPASPDPSFKGCVEGGQADVSGFSVMPKLNANESVIAIIEAAIDAVSYNTIFPGRYAFSSNGSGRFGLHYKIAIEALANNFSLSMATDADYAGDTAAQKVFNALTIRKLVYEKYKKNGISYKDIDNAIISGKIQVKMENSPHHVFFGILDQGEELLPVHVQAFETDENGKQKIIYVDSGEKSKRTVEYRILKDTFEFITNQEDGKVELDINTYEKLKSINKIYRERPLMSKDWNEELKLLGSDYIKEYNQCLKNDFINTPKLPHYLESLKMVNKPIRFTEDGRAIIVKKEIADQYLTERKEAKVEINIEKKEIEKVINVTERSINQDELIDDKVNLTTNNENHDNNEKTERKNNVLNSYMSKFGNGNLGKGTQQSQNSEEQKQSTEKVNESENVNETIFKAKTSKQELFNALYLRFYLYQKSKREISLEEIDDKIKNGEIRFYINKNSDHTQFVNLPWRDKQKYTPKEPEEGNDVFVNPVIRFTLKNSILDFEKGTNEVKVVQGAFEPMLKKMDELALLLRSSKEPKEVLKQMGYKFIKEDKDGWDVVGILGRGNNIKKYEVLMEKEKQKIKKESHVPENSAPKKFKM